MVSSPIFTSTTRAWCGIGRFEMCGEETSLTERLLRRDRWIVLSGLAAITLLSWTYILTGAGTGMSARSMTKAWLFPHRMTGTPFHLAGWTSAYWLIMLLMWWVMMIAMMTPSATPMILLYARATRYAQGKGQLGRGVVPVAAFAGGYLLVWFGFSLFTTLLQRVLEASGAISAMWMASTKVGLSAAVLILAGVYQLSPWKHRCLNHCRNPAEFLSQHRRPGRLGAVRMGIEHGAFCVGCCWVLMALLFVGGIMNVLWIAVLAIVVLLEKLAPQGPWFARFTGIVLLAWGAATLAV
jgi:predicted metal-binding membrane protein